MSKPPEGKSPGPPLDPIAALNALDLALASQQMEGEIRRLLAEFLPLLDAVERVCRGIDRLPPEQLAAKAEALAILAELAAATAERIGLETSARPGDRADRDAHEIVATVLDESLPAGVIKEVLEQGWRYRDEVLRRARVVASVPRQEPGQG